MREKLVFDCGRGCPIRLQQKGVRLGEVKLFITHLHSDHVNGIVDLWLTGRLTKRAVRVALPCRAATYMTDEGGHR
jgi:ribonuclease BN (tRNA processing enzyme)